MPRKAKHPSIQCQYSTWKIFTRDGVWYADGRSATPPLGKHSLDTRDKEQALVNLRRLDLVKAIQLGLAKPADLEPLASISIDSGWDGFIEHRGRPSMLGGASQATVDRYKQVRQHHEAFCTKQGILDWNSFGTPELEKFAECRDRMGRAYRTVHLELDLLKSVNKYLVESKRLPTELRIHCPLRKPQGTDAYCFSCEQVTAMIDYCNQSESMNWLGSILLGLSHTGMRIGELSRVRWSDVDLDHGFLTVADERYNQQKGTPGPIARTKGKRSRRIPLHPTLSSHLTLLARYPDGLVWHSPQGHRLASGNFRQQFVQYVIRPLQARFPAVSGPRGFARATPHSFRHYFCSQAFVCGASASEIKEWLGHADSKMVEHYRHLNDDDARLHMAKLIFSGPTATPAVPA